MSRVEELIKEYCPDGVEYKKISEVVTFRRGKGLSKSNKGTGNVPIILYGELYTIYGNYIHKIISHCNKDKAIKATKLSYDDLILPTSSTTKEAKIGKASVLKVNDPVYLGSDAIVMTAHDILNADFLMYYINSDIFEKEKMKCVKGTTVRHLNQSALSKIKIPVPPLPVQEEIARILDSFTELTAELTKELTARKKQYEYYRNEMLSFNGETVEKLLKRYCPNGVEYKLLDSCCEILDKKRKPIKKGNRESGPFPYYGANGVQDYVADYIFNGTFILVGEDGSVLTKDGHPIVTWAVGKIWVNNHAHIIKDNGKLNLRFLYHYLQTVDISGLVHGNIPKLTGKDFKNIKIPVPPLPIQEEIAHVLDSFSTMCTDLNSGLPAEIEARQKQYEYYRNKLLTFNELVKYEKHRKQKTAIKNDV